MGNSIFGGGNEKQQTEFKEKVDTHSKAILTVIERQKNIENSLELLNEKLELLDHNAIKNFKKIFNDTKNIKTDLRELKQDIIEIKDFNTKMSKQLKLMVTKDEVLKLEKYIDLWNPMEFITRGEMEEFRVKITSDIKHIINNFLKE